MYGLAVMEFILAAQAGISYSIKVKNHFKNTHFHWQIYKQDLKAAENNYTFKVETIYATSIAFFKNLFTEKHFFYPKEKSSVLTVIFF